MATSGLAQYVAWFGSQRFGFGTWATWTFRPWWWLRTPLEPSHGSSLGVGPWRTHQMPRAGRPARLLFTPSLEVKEPTGLTSAWTAFSCQETWLKRWSASGIDLEPCVVVCERQQNGNAHLHGLFRLAGDSEARLARLRGTWWRTLKEDWWARHGIARFERIERTGAVVAYVTKYVLGQGYDWRLYVPEGDIRNG